MSFRRTAFLALTFLMVISASLAMAADKAPRLTLVDPLKDFGTVAKGEKLDWSFTIKNTGTADLQILAVRPACGCTVADYDKVIKPGQTGKVTAHVDTTSFSGPVSKAVTVDSNDPSTPSAQLTIHAVVRPYVEAFPSGFVRYNLIQGDAQTQTVTIYSEEDAPFEILRAEVPGDFVKVDYKKIENAAERAEAGRAGQAQYKVNITLGGPTAPIGPMADKVKLVTNSKHQPEYLISLSGVVRPSYSVIPNILNFGEVTPAEAAAERSITLRSNDQKSPQMFKVTKVESSSPMFTAVAKPTEQAGEYQVMVKVAKGAKAGNIDGKLKIYTSDSINPVFELPVKGTIKAAGATK